MQLYVLSRIRKNKTHISDGYNTPPPYTNTQTTSSDANIEEI